MWLLPFQIFRFFISLFPARLSFGNSLPLMARGKSFVEVGFFPLFLELMFALKHILCALHQTGKCISVIEPCIFYPCMKSHRDNSQQSSLVWDGRPSYTRHSRQIYRVKFGIVCARDFNRRWHYKSPGELLEVLFDKQFLKWEVCLTNRMFPFAAQCF